MNIAVAALIRQKLNIECMEITPIDKIYINNFISGLTDRLESNFMIFHTIACMHVILHVCNLYLYKIDFVLKSRMEIVNIPETNK